jgi:GNAT superfamily N-acetyltransferase
VANVEPLSPQHNRAKFDCGASALNEFLQKTARQHQDKGVSKTFVLVDANAPAPADILGFYSLAACEAQTADLPAALGKRLPRTIPAVLLGRLAVDRSVQGQGLGAVLLVDAIRRVVAVASQVGIAGLFVDAKDDSAAAFYQKFGFAPLPSNPHRLFLPLKTLTQIAGA